MKKISTKSVIWSVLLIGIVAIGIITIKKAKNRDAGTSVAKTYDVVVSTQIVKQEPVKLTLPYLAVLMNDKDVKLSSKIPARVNFIKASGSDVKQGEVIAKLDNTSIQGNIASINAQLDAINVAIKNMEATHNRTLELLAVGGASIEQSQKEESKLSELNSKKEALLQKQNDLNNMLSYAIIKSPVNGNISKTMVNTGDMAMPGHPIANIQAKNGFYLLIRVPSHIKTSAIEYNNHFFEAIPLNSTFNGLAEYKAYADVPGMTSGNRVEVNVVIFDGNAILLPFDAVINRNSKSYVLVKQNNQAVAHEVNIIENGEQGIIIANNELLGKEIVIAKQDILLKLLTGISLKVKEE